MRFRCLVMDHDDTTVNSTATIHFPSFLAYLKLVRPEASYTLEDYFRKNFDPGIMALFTGELGFSEQELEGEFRFWQDWVRTRVPCAYPGIREILQRHKDAGGYIAVVSHSMRGSIERDYRENDLPEPDIIFGWEQPPEQRKPNTWPLEQIMERFGLDDVQAQAIVQMRLGQLTGLEEQSSRKSLPHCASKSPISSTSSQAKRAATASSRMKPWR